MTSDVDPNEAARLAHSDLSLYVDSLLDGSAILEVTWSSESPWVPGGFLSLSTLNPRILNLGYKGVVEALIIQLRPILQAMLSEAWPPF